MRDRTAILSREIIGPRNIMWGSDYPHFDSEYPGTVHELKDRSDISEKQKQKILSENAKEFLRL